MKHNIDPPTALPPWKATNERERRWMVEWVIGQLDAQDAESDMRQYELDDERDYYAPLPPAEQQRLRLEEAIQRAKHDDVRALRRLLGQIVDPRIAKFIHPPKREQGRRRFYPKDVWGRYAAEMIVADVKRVRALWKANYKGKWKRKRLRPTAEEIVAERRGWTEDEVIAAVKLLSR
jgi:hypothetical protein